MTFLGWQITFFIYLYHLVTNYTIMFVLEIKEMFAQKGVVKPYALLLRMGIPRTRARMMLNGTNKNVNLADLFKFCSYLNCTPKELLKVVPTKGSIALQNTPLQDWIKKEDVNLIHEMISMTPEEMDKMKEFYKELKSK